MADDELERHLAALFSDPPMAADAAAFADRVEARIERGARLRPWVVAACGFAGGGAAMASLAGAGVGATRLFAQATDIGQGWGLVVTRALAEGGLPLTAGAPWLLTALVGAAVLGAVRLVAES